MAAKNKAFSQPPLKKKNRTSPIEMVRREEYEEIKQFYKDVYEYLGDKKPTLNPVKDMNDLYRRAKEFVERHEY